MTLFLCVGDKMAYSFAGRRLSSDIEVQKQMLDIVGYRKLWLSKYSAKLFNNAPMLRIDARYWEKAGKQDCCFSEIDALSPILQKANILVLFRWNRAYPADSYADINLDEWALVSQYVFRGHSHDRIVKEVYVRYGKATQKQEKETP